MQEPGSGAPIPPPVGNYGPPAGGPRTGEPNGVLILILGILGVTICGICAPVAWIMGNNALALIDSGQGDPSQRQNVNIGRILGMVGCALIVLGIIFYVLVIGLAVVSGAGRPR